MRGCFALEPLLFRWVVLASILTPCPSAGQEWRSTNGPFSGEVTAVAVSREGAVVAGTNGIGLFVNRATDSEWIRGTSAAFEGIVIRSIVDYQGLLVVATAGRGIWQSPDDGETWTELNAGLGSLIVHALMVSRSGKLYAGSSSGVYKLSESGTWIILNEGVEIHDVRALAENSEGALFAGSYGRGVLRSDDLGVTWQLSGSGLASNIVRSLAVNDEDVIFVGTFGGEIVQRSEDGGQTWVASNEGLDTQAVWSIAIAPDGTFFAGSHREGVFASDDGRTWRRTTTPFTTVSGFAFGGGRVLVATRIGLLASDASTPEWTVEGIPFSRVNTLHRIGDRVLAGINFGGVHYSDDFGHTWHASSLNNEDIVRMAQDRDGSLLAGTFGSGIFRSIDDGLTWTQIWDTHRVVYSVAVDESNVVLAGTESGVYQFRNADSTWQRVSPTDAAMRSLLVTSDGVVLAGSEFESIWRSTDGGENWTPVASQLAGDIWIWDLVELPDGRIAAATTGLGVWLSVDKGLTWQPLPGTQDVVVSDLLVSETGHLVAASILGQVFVMSLDDDQAAAFGRPFLPALVRAVILMSDGTVMIGTDPQGVHVLDGMKLVASEPDFTVPKEAYLDVFPRPTSRSVTVRVGVDRFEAVRWDVVDMLGRTVASGLHRSVVNGLQTFKLDVSDLSPGLYWIQLSGDGVEAVRSVVVTR